MCTCLEISLIAVWEEYGFYFLVQYFYGPIGIFHFLGAKLEERLSLDFECVLKIPSLFGLNTRFCCVLTQTKRWEMDWTGGYITVCFFPIWQVSFFDGCDGVEM